ncbi:MAG: type IV pilus assembly protein PilB, partial [Candidatus Berkelbacteria bacterium Licking1014_96]
MLDILFAEGAIDQGVINKIDKESKITEETASEIILKEGKVSEKTLAEAISKSSGIPLVNLSGEKVNQEALAFIKKDEAIKNLIVPFYLDDKTLKIAAADIDIIEKKDAGIWQRIRSVSHRKIDLYIATYSEIKFALKSYGLDNEVKIIKVDSKEKDLNPVAKDKGILEVLVRQDLVSPEQAKKIKAEIEKKKLEVDDYLLEKKIVNPDELAKAYSSIYHYPLITLRGLDIPFEVINKFPEEISRKYRVVAFEMLGSRVAKVAVSRPFDPKIDELLNYVADKNELEVDRYITTDDEIEEALKSYESRGAGSGSARQEADLPVADTDIGRLLKEDVKSVTALEDIIKKGSVPLIVAGIVNFAIFRRASDVHLQPAEKNVRLRYRIDGVLNDITTLPIEMLPALVSRVKILSKLRIDEKRIPQDGRFEVVFNKKSVDIRVSTLPTTHGEKLVMRLLDTSRGTFSLDELGLRQEGFKKFIASITKPFGMIIACGPTGSGKTTTLYAALNYINKPGVNIVT